MLQIQDAAAITEMLAEDARRRTVHGQRQIFTKNVAGCRVWQSLLRKPKVLIRSSQMSYNRPYNRPKEFIPGLYTCPQRTVLVSSSHLDI